MAQYYEYDEVKILSQLISKIHKAVKEGKATTSIEASQIAKQVIESLSNSSRYKRVSQEQLIRLIAQGKPFEDFYKDLGLFLRAFKEDARDIRANGTDPEFSIRGYPMLQLWLPKLLS